MSADNENHLFSLLTDARAQIRALKEDKLRTKMILIRAANEIDEEFLVTEMVTTAKVEAEEKLPKEENLAPAPPLEVEPEVGVTLEEQVASFKRKVWTAAWKHCGCRTGKAAKMLGISYTSANRLLDEAGLVQSRKANVQKATLKAQMEAVGD